MTELSERTSFLMLLFDMIEDTKQCCVMTIEAQQISRRWLVKEASKLPEGRQRIDLMLISDGGDDRVFGWMGAELPLEHPVRPKEEVWLLCRDEEFPFFMRMRNTLNSSYTLSLTKEGEAHFFSFSEGDMQ